MKLTVTTASSAGGVWQRFADLAVDHALAVGEELIVPAARAVCGDDAVARRLPGLAVLTADGPPNAAAIGEVFKAFDEKDVARPRWLDPQRPDAAAELTARGFRRRLHLLLKMKAAPTAAGDVPGVLVLQGRAARGAYDAWCTARAADDAPAALLPRHLDDPQYESIVAMQTGHAIAAVGLQIRGQTGLVADLFVRPEDRLRGLALLLLSRASDIAARAQLAEVFTTVPADDEAAVRAVRRAGFETSREYFEWSAANQ